MRRIAGILFGVATHALFLVTGWQRFRFLEGGKSAAAPAARGGIVATVATVAVDGLLAVAFALPHGLFLARVK